MQITTRQSDVDWLLHHAALSPMLRDAWMSVVTKEPKTFNNLLGFERGLWQPKMKRFWKGFE
jgi:hypothetical protein